MRRSARQITQIAQIYKTVKAAIPWGLPLSLARGMGHSDSSGTLRSIRQVRQFVCTVADKKRED
jgi:hypothetical protein